MALTAEKDLAHLGQTKGATNHDHDLIHGLSNRLDALWRYDQYIANAEGKPALQEFWRTLKQQDEENIQRFKQLIAQEIKDSCF